MATHCFASLAVILRVWPGISPRGLRRGREYQGQRTHSITTVVHALHLTKWCMTYPPNSAGRREANDQASECCPAQIPHIMLSANKGNVSPSPCIPEGTVCADNIVGVAKSKTKPPLSLHAQMTKHGGNQPNDKNRFHHSSN